MKAKRKRKEERLIWWDGQWWQKQEILSCLNVQTTVKTDGGPDTQSDVGKESRNERSIWGTMSSAQPWILSVSACFYFPQQLHSLLCLTACFIYGAFSLCSNNNAIRLHHVVRVTQRRLWGHLKSRVSSSISGCYVWQKAPIIVSAKPLIARWL